MPRLNIKRVKPLFSTRQTSRSLKALPSASKELPEAEGTLIDLLTGLISPSAGHLKVDGRIVTENANA